ncbi:MAG TPA: LacI family DNA-binding transcriptional regulator [Acidimicrobiia bacterium]|nr:LacI family DNA-binding transcriptional regulator [Acidimicrobiia bacterium]
MTKQVTLRDVAREAGVHISTASRALNPETRSMVNDDTVDRVLATADQLGYRPHPLAQGLRKNRTMSVGMVIPDIENPLFGPIIAGAEQVLGGEGYSLLITNTDIDEGQTSEVVRALVERRVDGMILATASRSDDVIIDLIERGIHMVLVNRSTEGVAVPAILGDDLTGIGLAVDHLFSLGHERIGHVAGPQHLSTGLGRHQAFLTRMQSLRLAVDPSAVEESTWYQVGPGYKAAQTLLVRRPDLTAVVAANDLIALGCYRAVRESGKEVGTDVSITGYNDIPLLDLMQPPMTSVRVPYRQMGVEAANTLLPMMTSGSSLGRPVSIRLTPTLSIRESTAPPRS